jgi:hypothetical protein
MGMWLDPRIKAVIGGTGGYGAVRMLPISSRRSFATIRKSLSDTRISRVAPVAHAPGRLRVFHGRQWMI